MSNFIVSISGFGWSGSTAIRDLLKEHDGFCHFKHEYPFISDPYGFIDLENSLVSDWNFLKSDRAIRQFSKFVSQVSSKKSRINYFGIDLERHYDIEFSKILNDFINDLSIFRYNFASRVNYNYLSFLDKIRKKMSSHLGSAKDEHIFSSPSEVQFLEAVKRFHRSLFCNVLSENNLILEKVIPVNNIVKSMRYFDNIKVVVVDRDPRDVFMDMSGNNGLFWGGTNKTVSVQKMENFVVWKNEMYKRSDLTKIREGIPNVLYLRFEDLIVNYDENVLRLQDFLGLDPKSHINRGKFLKPKESMKNIGKWKKFHDSTLIEQIRRGVPY